MIDITINLTIDEDHEEDYFQIITCIENIPGVEKAEEVEGSYFEYNIDSTPHWTRDYEEVDLHEYSERLLKWILDKYDGADYLLSKNMEGLFRATDNSSGQFLSAQFSTREEAIAWINGDNVEESE